MKQLEQNVIQWSTDRGIFEHSTAQAQTLKAVSEMGELADAIIKGDDGAAKDAVGDVIVCLINVAHMRGFDLREALSEAWCQIKDRKGHMVAGGAFVKDEA